MPIKLLNDDLINKIAAGEVVERPASIVKELVENSIDANADQITVELKNGGIDLIQITDNGSGIDKNDMKMSVVRHATSKIQSIEDLSHIQSFGFRGEALSSISSVSKTTIQSKKRGELSGAEMISEGNSEPIIKDIGCPEGAKIRVAEIFYNIPARRKFLKNANTEYKHILDTMINFAIIHPHITFRLIHNEKIVFDYTKKEIWQDRVKEVLGQDNFKNLKYFDFEIHEIALKGFVSLPVFTRSNRDHQYLFINNRQVTNNIVNKAIYEAYAGQIPRNSHPIFVVKLDLEPELVDVNVHPRKTEVKFQNSQVVFQAVERAISSLFEAKSYENNQLLANNFAKRVETPRCTPFNNHSDYTPPKNQSKYQNNFKQALEFNRQIFQTSPKTEQIAKNYKLLGQVKNTYLLVEKENGIAIIDQHATHERMIYDQLQDIEKIKENKSQQLLFPIKLELGIKEIETAENNLEILNNLGFDIEKFGANTLIINSVPDIFEKQENLEEVIKNIISDMKENFSKINSLDEKRNKIIAYTACRSAVKAGDRLNFDMQEKLTEAVAENKIKTTCPHGRPISFEIDWNEVEKRCKRK